MVKDFKNCDYWLLNLDLNLEKVMNHNRLKGSPKDEKGTIWSFLAIFSNGKSTFIWRKFQNQATHQPLATQKWFCGHCYKSKYNPVLFLHFWEIKACWGILDHRNIWGYPSKVKSPKKRGNSMLSKYILLPTPK